MNWFEVANRVVWSECTVDFPIRLGGQTAAGYAGQQSAYRTAEGKNKRIY
jgi:hypothetical protein